MSESDTRASLEERLKRWKKDHVQGRIQVVIRYGRPRGFVRLYEFGDNRLSFHLAAHDLEGILLSHLRVSIGHLATEIGAIKMPPPDACVAFEFRSKRVSSEYADQFKANIAELTF